MPTAKQIMALAASYIGTKEYPRNSNNVIFNTHYYGGEVQGAAYPWCCAFVWDIFRMAGASALFYDGKKTAYCPAVATWGRKYSVDKTAGRYGDIVLFDWGRDGVQDHIGLIEARNSDGTYTCIEGNTAVGNDSNGGEVMRRTRYLSQINMIIRPQYDGQTSTAPTTDQKTETTTKEGTCNVELDIIRKGSKGNAVRALQLLLIGNSISCGSYGADGDFGSATDRAVRQFQTAKGLTVDGIVGAKTWSALLR